MAIITLLLPERARLPGPLPAAVGKRLARADWQAGQAGSPAQLRRHFRLVPDHWPVASLTRLVDAGDTAGGPGGNLADIWLRADPAHVAPDMNGARLLGWGETLGVDQDDVQALLPALRPLFGDAGFQLDAPHPARWYLRLPKVRACQRCPGRTRPWARTCSPPCRRATTLWQGVGGR